MKRVRTVERDPGEGWIARNPWTGDEWIKDFRWRTRAVAQTVADEARRLGKPRSDSSSASGKEET